MDKVIENFVSLKIDSSNNDNRKQEKNKSKKGNRKQQQAGNNRQWTEGSSSSGGGNSLQHQPPRANSGGNERKKQNDFLPSIRNGLMSSRTHCHQPPLVAPPPPPPLLHPYPAPASASWTANQWTNNYQQSPFQRTAYQQQQQQPNAWQQPPPQRYQNRLLVQASDNNRPQQYHHQYSSFSREAAGREEVPLLQIKRVIPEEERCAIPRFTDHRVLRRFFTSREGDILTDGAHPPPILQRDVMTCLDSLKGRSLRQGWEQNVLITRYQPFRELKGLSLHQSIRCHQHEKDSDAFAFLWRASSGDLPFVAFAGVFVAIMRMSSDVETVAIHCWKEGSHILMKKGREKEDDHHVISNDPSRDPRHCRANFMRMLLLPSPSQSQSSPPQDDGQRTVLFYECEKHYKISKVRFGKHTLVPMSEVNALDSDMRDVKVLMRREFADKQSRDSWFKERYQEIWAHAVLVDQRKILTAVRRAGEDAVITDVNLNDNANSDNMIEEMERMLAPGSGLQPQRDPTVTRSKWHEEQALDLLDRFLSFVRRAVLSAPPGRVVSLLYRKGRTHDMEAMVQNYRSSENIKRVCNSNSNRSGSSNSTTTATAAGANTAADEIPLSSKTLSGCG